MMSGVAVDHAELARRSFQAIEQPGSVDLPTVIHPDYRNWEATGAGADMRGPEAFATTVTDLGTSFPELSFEILALISSEDLVAVRTVMHGIHDGPMRALPATGKRFAQRQSHWYRIAEGRLIEHWANRDDLGFLHQVGAAPALRVGGVEDVVR